MYKVRQHVRDVYWRAAIILVLTGVGFAFAAGYVGPWLKDMVTKARKGSRWGGGKLGIWIFYAAAYGALYYAYLVMERRGPGGLRDLLQRRIGAIEPALRHRLAQ